MQMVERPWGVSVHGSATVTAKPDLVRIRFRVVRVERTPSQAFDVGTRTVGAVREVLGRHAVPDEAVHGSQLNLRSSAQYHSGSAGEYHCEASFTVESRDLEGVRQLLVDLIAAGANEIDGLDFDVAARDELLTQARRQAVDAARRTARLYADAAGVHLGDVVHIEEAWPDRGDYAVAAAQSSPTAQISVPGQVAVSAAVVLGVEIG